MAPAELVGPTVAACYELSTTEVLLICVSLAFFSSLDGPVPTPGVLFVFSYILARLEK